MLKLLFNIYLVQDKAKVVNSDDETCQAGLAITSLMIAVPCGDVHRLEKHLATS